MNYISNMVFLSANSKVWFVIGPIPIPALACPDTPGLGLPSNHSYGHRYGFGYGYGNGSQSSPVSSRICPAPESEILVIYAG